ncbi:hypothetical protein X474_15495 [Dethiosulfatarculus sandiegensis]|uniref:Uncharacterized protein n=1 Tax=Dethiosulfatarculus sandiegensis TaxID=1429043 RepID=A0A0D2HRG0_9BACT|nr:hypothetical protein X474_15495 [Dethiosulfatarculus sandiegensis]
MAGHIGTVTFGAPEMLRHFGAVTFGAPENAPAFWGCISGPHKRAFLTPLLQIKVAFFGFIPQFIK